MLTHVIFESNRAQETDMDTFETGRVQLCANEEILVLWNDDC